jgi:hypothetical protein
MKFTPMFDVRYGSQTDSYCATSKTTITKLMSEIQILTELFASRKQISWGYPPQQIPTDSTAVADLGIKRREPFTVT